MSVSVWSARQAGHPEIRHRPRILPAAGGGLRIEGRVGTSKIPQNQFRSRSTRAASSKWVSARRGATVAAGDVVLLPEGTYYISSPITATPIRWCARTSASQASKLTDVIISHRAAVITLKLVSDKGGEALANTAWSVITPGGDVIKESIGAFPRVVLSEGEYRAIAKNEGKSSSAPSMSSTVSTAKSKSSRADLAPTRHWSQSLTRTNHRTTLKLS